MHSCHTAVKEEMDYPCLTEALDSQAPWLKETLDSLVSHDGKSTSFFG